jgi:hypothetical protein
MRAVPETEVALCSLSPITILADDTFLLFVACFFAGFVAIWGLELTIAAGLMGWAVTSFIVFIDFFAEDFWGAALPLFLGGETTVRVVFFIVATRAFSFLLVLVPLPLLSILFVPLSSLSGDIALKSDALASRTFFDTRVLEFLGGIMTISDGA